MKLHYYPETASLYIELIDAPGAEVREIAEGLVADFDADGNVVGLDIDHASRKLDLSKVETINSTASDNGRVRQTDSRQLQRRRCALAPCGRGLLRVSTITAG
jgi:uncharacterized protein YuzE